MGEDGRIVFYEEVKNVKCVRFINKIVYPT